MANLKYCRSSNSITLSAEADDDEIRAVRQLLHPTRLAILDFIHTAREVTVSDLMESFDLGQHVVNTALDLFIDLHLIGITLKSNPGHGKRRVITCLIPSTRDCVDIQLALGRPQEP